MKRKTIGKYAGILNRQFQTYIGMAFKDIDITFTEYIFLANMYFNEGINQEELSALVFLDKSLTARAIKSLEEKGFIKRKNCEEDKRAKKLYLTDKAMDCKEYVYSIVKKWDDYITEGMSEENIDIVIHGLEFMGNRAENADFHKLLVQKENEDGIDK